MFPPHVAARLRAGETVICDKFPVSTILFSDIVGFTSLSSTMEPEKVADMLERFFARLDALVVEHGLFKVETIGDAASTRRPWEPA